MQKRQRQQRLFVSESALHCNHPGCSFQARNQAGLTNHQRQRHFTIQIIQCQYCHQAFHHQGLHNHQRFSQSRPPATQTQPEWPASPHLFGVLGTKQKMDGWCVCVCVCVGGCGCGCVGGCGGGADRSHVPCILIWLESD